MHHAGAGVIGIDAPGSVAIVRTLASIQANGHELRLAQACANGAHHASASCSAPSAIVNATHGTTARLATTAYGENSKNTAAVSGHVPSCVATESTSASRTARGHATRASIHCSSAGAQTKIAPTQENESANDAVATLAGFTNATTSAAIASAFHENVARPHARAASAAVAIDAARIAGNCPPLHSTNSHTQAAAIAHVTARGIEKSERSATHNAAAEPTCSPAVTSTCTVPVS